MNKEDQLKFCQKCQHKKTDLRYGTLCGLTSQPPNFRDFCPDFEKSTEQIKKENQRQFRLKQESRTNNAKKVKGVKSPVLVTLGVIISVIFIGLRIARIANRVEQNNRYEQTQRQYDRQQKNRKQKVATKKRANAVAFFKTKNRQETYYGRLEKDSIFQLTDNIRLTIRKTFRVSTADKNDELPVFAIFKPYYFAYNKVEKHPTKTLTNQWKELRDDYGYLNRNSTFTITDTLETHNNSVKYKFEYTNANYKKVIGVAQLTEENGQRYFFQFSTNSDDVSYRTLIKYLGYYINIK